MTFAHLPDVAAEVRELAERFESAGHRVYLVGGVVRDLWLDRPPVDGVDLDLTTDADPDAIKEIVAPLAEALWLQGERFGTVGVRISGRDHEITTHRSEAYAADSRKPVVAFSDAIDADLSRRDFTINAMAVRVPSLELVDPFGGVEDLEARRLRTPLDPEISFIDDPLRMLRAARFAAGYRLEPVPDVVDAMADYGERLDIVSTERIRDELDKLLALGDPTAGVGLLGRTGLLHRILPEIDGPGLAARSAAVRELEARAELRLCGYLFGVELERVSRRMAQLRHSNGRRQMTVATLDAAMSLSPGVVADDADLRRWVAAAGDHADDAAAIVSAVADDGDRITALLAARRAELGADLDDLDVPLSGADVIAELGVAEGPVVGAALDHLRELRYELGPMTPAVARRHLREWWDERGSR